MTSVRRGVSEKWASEMVALDHGKPSLDFSDSKYRA
jgi:hypothetical protein